MFTKIQSAAEFTAEWKARNAEVAANTPPKSESYPVGSRRRAEALEAEAAAKGEGTWRSKSAEPTKAAESYEGWETSTFEVPEERIYEARAIVKDEGGLITRSTSARPGIVTLVVMTPPKGA